MRIRALESSRRPPVPEETFPIPADGPFALLFLRTRIIGERLNEDEEPESKPKPKPTATEATTTGKDEVNPNPAQNEEIDWEYDD